jgi:undecaprenyl diphosphate synthase
MKLRGEADREEKTAEGNSDTQVTIPEHVAIIMDGNGRWASRRRLPRLEGHRQGAKAVRRTVEFARKTGIKYLTLYAFSTENWQRPDEEVSGLMRLLSQFIDSELNEIHSHGIRFTTIGDISRLPQRLVEKIERAKAKTRGNGSMCLIVALSYGGRHEIVSAALRLADQVNSGQMSPEHFNESSFSELLDTKGIPDPDLLIRTGGEVRVSNFLLWQLAYTELYFTQILWPDFDEAALSDALEEYRSRQRRFGMTTEQKNSSTCIVTNQGNTPCSRPASSLR